MNFLLVAIGGGLGSILRFYISGIFAKLSKKDFSYGTLFVNITGSILLALLIRFNMGNWMFLLLGTGLLGGYTTFSTFNLEVAILLKKKEYLKSLIYIIKMYSLCIIPAFIVIAA